MSILTIQLLVVFFTFVRWPTTVTAKELTSRQKENLTAKKKTRGKISSMPRGHFLFFFLLPWGYSFCHESFSFCREVFLFAPRLILFPRQPYLWNSVHEDSWCFFNMWVFVRTSTNFAHLVSFHYSSHRIRGLARSENAGHFCTSHEWKQSFENAAFCSCCSRRTRTRFNLIPRLHAFR